MTNPDTIELHDALLKEIITDYVAKIVTIKFEYYKSANDSGRVPLLIVFSDVESISQIVNLHQLQKNAFAGNVNYWVPAKDAGTTYIYFVDGCIGINAKRIAVN